MQLYENKVDDALRYLSRPDILHPTGDKPICYVTYDVEDVMIIYRQIDTMIVPKARYYDFDPVVVSLGKVIQDYITSSEYYNDLQDPSIEETDLFDSLRNELAENNVIANRLLEIQNELKSSKKNPLMIIKDLELLHPYAKLGPIEQIIYNQIEVPMLVLYPGNTQGTARQFLNIYTMDGSYRSKNF